MRSQDQNQETTPFLSGIGLCKFTTAIGCILTTSTAVGVGVKCSIEFSQDSLKKNDCLTEQLPFPLVLAGVGTVLGAVIFNCIRNRSRPQERIVIVDDDASERGPHLRRNDEPVEVFSHRNNAELPIPNNQQPIELVSSTQNQSWNRSERPSNIPNTRGLPHTTILTRVVSVADI
jgi:hypothetical protein